jgi:hypothetical protein
MEVDNIGWLYKIKISTEMLLCSFIGLCRIQGACPVYRVGNAATICQYNHVLLECNTMDQ